MDSRNNNPCLFFSLFMFLFFLFSIKAHLSFAADTISAGESLIGRQTIISKDQTFELGFFTPGKSLNFYIGIWYHKISVENKTVVWVANREKPIKNPTTAEFRLLGNGNLVLIDQSQRITVWSTNSTSNPLNSTEAVLGDDGNLVLRDGSNTSNVIWESFDNPTNTWLPGGKLGFNKITNNTYLLTSWKSEEDPAPGIFSVELDPSGSDRYFIQWNGSQGYWSSGEWNGQILSGERMEVDHYIHNFSYITNVEESYLTYSVYDKSILSRFVMDISGQIRLVNWLEETKQWDFSWSQPSWSCDVYARCGYFGICNQTSVAHCDCFPGFNPRFPGSWSLGDTAGGCVRNTSLQCGNNDKFLLMPNMRMPLTSELLSRVGSIEECQSACSNNCFCNAFSYGSPATGCSLWNEGLLNFEKSFYGGDLYLKLVGSQIQNARDGTQYAAIIIPAVLTVIVTISSCTYFSFKWMAKQKGSDPTKRELLDWTKRFQIIRGITRGILYLHRDSRLKVIHRDLKPSNVLLDEELNPKISDFGMARIFGSDELQANTNRVVGTYGYMSPEYALEGQFSEKSDVFSFGVLLLEIVSGRRNTSFYNHSQSSSLLKHAWLLWNENKIQSLIEPMLSKQPHVELEIVRCIHVGLLCVQEFATDRPTMSTMNTKQFKWQWV